MADTFDHERLIVYQVSLEFVAEADAVARSLPTGRSYLVDQLQRASSSIVLNTAEGAGELSAKENARFYRMAQRSATECAALLDICRTLKLVDEQRTVPARGMLLRIVSMLIGLGRSITSATQRESGTGRGKGTSTARCR